MEEKSRGQKTNEILKDFPDAGGEKNWIEDYEHENGFYQHVCRQCSFRFYGHKRRTICKTCK